MAYKDLPKKQRNEIKIVFREWRGRPDKRQSKTLRHYGISYSTNNNSHACFIYGGQRVFAPSNPGTEHAGRNLASGLIKMLEGRLKAT